MARAAETRAKLNTMTAIKARSRSWAMVGGRLLFLLVVPSPLPVPSFFFSGMMLASRSLASSAVSTGVLPCLTTCLGPRTELAGLKSMTPPLVSQSKHMRMAARCCLTVGADRALVNASM